MTRSPLLCIPADLAAQGFSFRTEGVGDDGFLLALYRSTRAVELSQFGWSDEQKGLFIAQQFDAQRRHYRGTLKACSFDVIEKMGMPIGRLYVEERPEDLHVVDIALVPSERGQGIGTSLLRGLIKNAARANKGISLFVERFNPALALYLRLGFAMAGDHGIYLEMKHPAPVPVS
jgi:ribosomal protein S18 acetylase RimI-like enzyme